MELHNNKRFTNIIIKSCPFSTGFRISIGFNAVMRVCYVFVNVKIPDGPFIDILLDHFASFLWNYESIGNSKY